jgi:hypothetical protein
LLQCSASCAWLAASTASAAQKCPFQACQRPAAEDASPFTALLLGGSAGSLLVRLHSGNAQCLVDSGSSMLQPACLDAGSEAQAAAMLASWFDVASTGGNGRRLSAAADSPGTLSRGGAGGRRLRQQQLPAMPRRTLTCGAEHQALFGVSGYNDDGGWCSKALASLAPAGACACTTPAVFSYNLLGIWAGEFRRLHRAVPGLSLHAPALQSACKLLLTSSAPAV